MLSFVLVLGLMPGMSMIAQASTEETLLTTVTYTNGGSQTHSPEGVVTVTLNGVTFNDNTYGWLFFESGTVTVAPVDGVEITKVRFRQNGKNPVDDDLAPFTLTFNEGEGSVETSTGTVYAGSMDGVTSIEVYRSETIEEYTVTYKVVNGTWDGTSTADKTETVASGGKPASVPTGMKANSGYTGGSWDTDPSTATISADTTFTYTFNSEADSDGSLIVESADGAPACEVSGLSSDDIFAIAEAENFAGAGAPDFALKLKVSNIDEIVSAGEKEIAESYVAAMDEDVRIAMYTDMSLFLVGGGHRLQVTDLGRKALTVSMTVPGRFRAPAGFTRHFLVFQIHDGAVNEVGRSTTLRVLGEANRFSTYVLAYYDVEDGGSGSHEHSHHICEDGHKFAFCVMQAPTTEVDGFAEWRCTQCGIYDWNDHDNADARETVTISAYPVFNDTLENNIKAAETGATVSIETKRWVSVRRGVLEALAEKPGVTLSIKFAKDGTDYVLTIPGGDPALAGILASGDRFFSFTTLGNTYGLTAVEK